MMRNLLRGLIACNRSCVLAWAGFWLLAGMVSLLSLGVLEIAERHRLHIFFGLVGALVLSAIQLAVRIWEAQSAVQEEPPKTGRLSAQPLDYLISILNLSRACNNGIGGVEVDQIIVDSCRDCFECDAVSLMTLDESGGQLRVTAYSGQRKHTGIRDAVVRLGEGVAGTVARNRSPLILGREFDAKRFPGFQKKSRTITSAMVAPVVVGKKVVGVLNVSSTNPAVSYTGDDLRVLCVLAEHAGIVASHSQALSRAA